MCHDRRPQVVGAEEGVFLAGQMPVVLAPMVAGLLDIDINWRTYKLMVPDHVYHSLGTRGDVHFTRVLGRMVNSEVTVLLGCSGCGGIEDGGRIPRPMGHCNPLDMCPSDPTYVGR